MVKRFFMTQLWRIQQSYTLLSLILWGIVIVTTSFPIISPIWFPFLARFGISASTPGAVAVTLVLMFFLVFGSLYSFGFVYDRYLRLWREQLDVSVEKNPYAREKLSPKEVMMWRHIFLPALRGTASPDAKTRAEIEFVERWVAKSLGADSNIREAVEEAEGWIRSEAPAAK